MQIYDNHIPKQLEIVIWPDEQSWFTEQSKTFVQLLFWPPSTSRLSACKNEKTGKQKKAVCLQRKASLRLTNLSDTVFKTSGRVVGG